MISMSTIPLVSGQRLSFDVFTHDECLLLLRGTAIKSAAEVARIQASGYFKQPLGERINVFAAMSALADRLGHIYGDIRERPGTGIFSKRVKMLAGELIQLCDTDPDASFASIHLNNLHSYITVHSMMAAVVCCRLGLASGLHREQRVSLVCAALTHDLGLLDMVDLINSKDMLSEGEMERVRQHVQRGVQLLGSLGVTDTLWLSVVADHHEFLDGSGYAGKRGDDLAIGARILALADAYSAMLRPRPYRDRLMARKALEALYSDGLDRYDGRLIETLIWDLGFYPPGSVLRLATREMAVVIRNSPGILDGPNVACFTDALGRPLLTPVMRNTNDPEFEIIEVLDPALATRMGRQIEKCWDGRGQH